MAALECDGGDEDCDEDEDPDGCLHFDCDVYQGRVSSTGWRFINMCWVLRVWCWSLWGKTHIESVRGSLRRPKGSGAFANSRESPNRTHEETYP